MTLMDSTLRAALQASGAVAAPVKRLALDHDLSQPVPKAANAEQENGSLDADLSALYEERAHGRKDLEVKLLASIKQPCDCDCMPDVQTKSWTL